MPPGGVSVSKTTRLSARATNVMMQRLYYRIVLAALACVLVVQLFLSLLMGGHVEITVQVLALYAGILLLSWIGYELAQSGADRAREPTGFFFVVIGLLLVLLCAETGGLASPYYMLVFTTCLFGALVLRFGRALFLTTVTVISYCGLTWAYQQQSLHVLESGPGALIAAIARSRPPAPNELSALVVNCGFLVFGTLVAARFAAGLRQQVGHLEEDATRDPLTGLPNRRAFTAKAELEMDRVKQWDWPLAILVIDLDHFKSVNDRFGHKIGDDVLVEAARLLRDAAGPADHLARIGGEEFAVAAAGTDRRHGADLADRIVRTFRTHDWGRIQPGLSLTCSIGVSIYQSTPGGRHAPRLKDLIDDADQALLRVKANERDGYLLAGDEVQAPPPRLVPRRAATPPRR